MSRNAISGISKIRAHEMLQQYNEKVQKAKEGNTKEELYLKKLLAARSAHIPGNNWCQDYIQWMLNNHPILALCFRHRLNPVGFWPRIVILISSISFGLTVTNLLYLFYQTHPDANGTVIKIQLGNDTTNSATNNTFEVTYEAVVLWTFGGFVHSLLDLGMWHLNACVCCLQSFCARTGPYISIGIAAMLTAASTFAIYWRADYELDMKGNSTDSIPDDQGENVWNGVVDHFSTLQFLWIYFIELFSVWFIHFPIMATIFFSGALYGVGWGCIGGRPKEMERQKRELDQIKNDKHNVDEDKDVFHDNL